MVVFILIFLFFAVAFGYIFYAYNRLTQIRNTAETEWSQIDVLLKKRHDLIPNIIEVVKGYAKHEKDTLERISYARASGMHNVKQSGNEEEELSKHVASILALREAYPDLKANQNFLDLQKELFEIEEEISERRFNYNDIVKAYNDFVLKFPGNVVSGMIGFSLLELFEFTGSREAPKLNFGQAGEREG